METNLAKKLIVVMNSEKMRLFEATGIKIEKGLETVSLVGKEEHTHAKRDGFNHKMSTPSSFLDPHNTAKDIQLNEASHLANQHLVKVISSGGYGSIILACEAKMLGHFRNTVDTKVKAKISDEMAKDIIKLSTGEIEKIVFGK